MNKIVYSLALLGLIVIISCNPPTKKGKVDENNVSGFENHTNKDCDEFLKQYEDSIDSYLIVVNEYLKNPTDDSLAVRYLKAIKQATVWNAKWESLVECADDEAYKDRFDEISRNLEDKINELGI